MAAPLIAKPTPHLLSLPPKTLQHIYLCSLSPSLPRASLKLGSILSADICYKVTFLHAFWNNTPLLYHGRWTRPVYKPGRHVRTLFAPSRVPVSGMETEDVQTRQKLQETVLRWRWCTFSNAMRWLKEVMQAVMKDLFLTSNLPSSSEDQRRLNLFIATFSANCAGHQIVALTDGSNISRQYDRPFGIEVVVSHYGRNTFSPNITVTPMNFLVIPSCILAGNPEWTDGKLNFLKMLSSYVDLSTVNPPLKDLHEGMRNAIEQDHYDALLTLLWLATLSVKERDAWSGDDNWFEPPKELFSLVARRGRHAFSATANTCSDSETRKKDPPISAKLFKLLLRAHARSMPTRDRHIEKWASQLLTYENSAVKAFAIWILRWSKTLRSRDLFKTTKTGRITTIPVTHRGTRSRIEKEAEMAKRFMEIWRGGVPTFTREVEEGCGESLLDERSWE